ncbi:Autophagy protein 22 [Entomortierella beljakovae]|nr:Autophagy protein 22 [Entomortierella beljakovae]
MTIPCPKHEEDIPQGDKCVARFGFIYVEPTSYALLINVVTVWCTIVVSLGTSALADHGRSSKKFMMTFCTLLALTTSVVFIGPLKPEVWWVSGLLVVIDSKEYILEKVKVSTFLSGGASAAGFAGGILLTVLATLLLTFTEATTITLGYCFIMSGIFVLIFMTAYGFLSYQRTSPPLPEGSNRLTYGYVRIAKTLRQVRTLKSMSLYLCAWFILGDGLTSATSMAILIAQESLNTTNDTLIIAALIQYITAGSSMWFWIWLQNKKNVQPKSVIVINSMLFSLIPIYNLLGGIKNNPLGLKHVWELFVMAAFFGFFIGAINSANRVVFSMFIPLGHENELFALFEMAGVSSSWIGPLVCAAIIEQSGIRDTWWFLLSQFIIPPAILYFVNVEVGRLEAVEFYKREHEDKAITASEMTALDVVFAKEKEMMTEA